MTGFANSSRAADSSVLPSCVHAVHQEKSIHRLTQRLEEVEALRVQLSRLKDALKLGKKARHGHCHRCYSSTPLILCLCLP